LALWLKGQKDSCLTRERKTKKDNPQATIQEKDRSLLAVAMPPTRATQHVSLPLLPAFIYTNLISFFLISSLFLLPWSPMYPYCRCRHQGHVSPLHCCSQAAHAVVVPPSSLSTATVCHCYIKLEAVLLKAIAIGGLVASLVMMLRGQ
jgi:hypothetical protein